MNGVLALAVAASVAPALEEVAAAFREETGAAVSVSAGSSGKLAAQIAQGAPFDVLVAADMTHPGARPYARGRLIVWTRTELGPSLEALASTAAARVAVADPRSAPYGRAALAALEKAGLLDAVRPKLVYGESVAQVNQFVFSRAADAGLTAKSAAFAPAARGLGRWAEVPAGLYEPVVHGVTVLKKSPAAEAFAAFLAGKKGRAILRRHGFD